MSEYEEMVQEEQISHLEEFANDVLVQYGISAKSLICVNHAFNTTFKVTGTDDKTYAMRINTNSKKWPEHVWAEVQWLEKISKEGLIRVPKLVANLQGEFFSNHYFFYDGGNLNIVLTEWIDGEVIEDSPTEQQLFELGKAMAILHESGKTWVAEGYANFKKIDMPLMVNRDHLFAEEDERITPELYELLRDVNMEAVKVFDSLREHSAPQLIHADLHFGNVIAQDGSIAILDFDDAGMGFPLQDLAIALFYLRSDLSREEHLLAGYRSIAPLPQYEPKDLETLIASRSLALLNYLFETTTADDIKFIPVYLDRTAKRLKNFKQSGRFLL